MITAASTVGVEMVVYAAVVFALIVTGGLLALRKHNRMFPKGWDRTGWEPNSTRGWLATKFIGLSGGRG